MFRGIANVNLDDRGRLALPVRYREQMRTRSRGQVVVTINPEPAERCLFIYPERDFRDLEDEVRQRDSSRPNVRRFQRRFVGHATEGDLDGNGRVLIPQLLRDYVGLEKKAVIVGQINKLEIWQEDLWRKTLTSDETESMTGLEGIRL